MKIPALLVMCAVFLSRVVAAEPAHLEPVSAFDRDDSIQLVFERLVGKRQSSLWMLCLPSFVPEYAVVLRSKRDDSDAKKYQSFVEVAEAKTPIFGGMEGAKYDPKAKIYRISKDLAEADAHLLASAAFEVLKQTRFADPPSQGCDGETFIFCFDRLSGRIWSPSEGQPAMLVKAWSALSDYARAKDPKTEEAALSSFRSACAAIQKTEAQPEVK